MSSGVSCSVSISLMPSLPNCEHPTNANVKSYCVLLSASLSAIAIAAATDVALPYVPSPPSSDCETCPVVRSTLETAIPTLLSYAATIRISPLLSPAAAFVHTPLKPSLSL